MIALANNTTSIKATIQRLWEENEQIKTEIERLPNS
jgi:regulator of replication initiation timing